MILLGLNYNYLIENMKILVFSYVLVRTYVDKHNVSWSTNQRFDTTIFVGVSAHMILDFEIALC